MIDLSGRLAVVFGVASEDSIAWAIAKSFAQAGCRIVLAYQFKFRSRVLPLAESLDAVTACVPCDVSQEEEVKKLFAELAGEVDILVHSVAFAEAATFQKPVIFASAEEFRGSLEVSAYSLLRLCRHALPRMARGGSVMTLTYLGATRVVPSYHVMGIAKACLESCVREAAVNMGTKGIRVNAISAGPVRTLAAGSIPGFDGILGFVERCAPLRENITQEDVAGTALFLASDLSRRVTGQTLFVDSGFSIVGVPPGLGDPAN